MFNDPIMQVINKNFTYKDRRRVLDIMTESSAMKDKVYGHIGEYFLGSIMDLRPTEVLGKYLKSNGDITKMEGYDNMNQSLEVLSHDANPDISKSAIKVQEAVGNLKNRKKSFEVGCKVKDSYLCKLIYGAMAKLCMASTSLLIANSNPLTAGKDRVTDSVAIKGIETFNHYSREGTLDKAIRYDLNLGHKAIREGVLDTPIDVLATIGSVFITAIRSAVYWIYYTRMDLAEYCEQQAAYLEMNKVQLKNRTDLSADEKKEIIRKQTEWQQRLLKWSDQIQLDDVKAARKAKERAANDEKKMNSRTATTGKGSDDQNSQPDFF